MIRTVFLAVLVTLATTLGDARTLTRSQEQAPTPGAMGLDPYELVGVNPGSIVVADGEIRLTGRPLGYFATKQDYGDFHLSFEWKFERPDNSPPELDSRCNSGVLVHVVRPHKVWPDCVQVQLAQVDPGSLFAMGGADFEGRSNPPAQKAAIRPAGQWNRAEITCRDGILVSVLNGVEVARGKVARSGRGPIGWQSESSPIRFRDLRLQKLD